MNQQEFVDKVVAHLKTMKSRAGKEIGSPGSFDFECRYLDDKGNKCAIGCLVPDGHPGQNYRGGVPSLLDKYQDLIGVAVYSDYKPYERLPTVMQAVHDDCRNWDEEGITEAAWAALREKLKTDYGLELNL